jgi:DNA-binding transcriptional regulator YiaG
MPRNKQYRSNALAAVHEMMVDLHTVGAIDKHTMSDFDKACLTPVQDLLVDEELQSFCIKREGGRGNDSSLA